MCPGFRHIREETTTSTSIAINGLEENSIYTVTISAVNNEFNTINTTSELTITTPAAGMLSCHTYDYSYKPNAFCKNNGGCVTWWIHLLSVTTMYNLCSSHWIRI